MSDKTLTIKAGDRLPALEISLVDSEGNPLDLTLYSSIFLVVAPCVSGRRIVDMKPMMKKQPQSGDNVGKVTYPWAAGETDVPGEYKLEVVLSPNFEAGADQQLMTLPGGGYGTLTIIPRL